MNSNGEPKVFIDLDEALQCPADVIELRLRDKNVEFPAGFGKLIHLEKLVLDNLNLNQIPDCFANFPKLKYLEISSLQNHLELPKSIYELETLETLILRHSDNLAIDLKKVAQLKNLKTLDLVSNKTIEEIPAELASLINLEKIVLSFVKVNHLPSEIFETINKLKYIDLYSTAITELPDILFKNNTIEYLNYASVCNWQNVHEFKRLPDALFQCRTLKRLAIDYKAKELQTQIRNLTNLEELTIVGKDATLEIPAEIGCLTQLKELDIQECAVESFPESMGNLKALQKISCMGISTLPDSFTELESLTAIHFSNTQLTKLPSNLGNLTNLDRLEIDGSEIVELPESITHLQNLRVLKLTYGKLGNLPDKIGDLKNLQFIYLDNNAIEALPESLANLEKLRTLDLGHNKLTGIPEGILELPELKELDLEGQYFDQELANKLKKLHKSGRLYRLVLPKANKGKEKVIIKECTELAEPIIEQFKRLEIPVIEECRPLTLIKGAEKYPVPASITRLLKSLNQLGIYYYPKWEATIDTVLFTGGFEDDELDESYLNEYSALDDKPFISIFNDQHDSFYLLRADDQNPADPSYYFLDHDDFNLAEIEPQGKIAQLLADLYTRKLANQLLKTPEYDSNFAEIEFYLQTGDSDLEDLRKIEVRNAEVVSLQGLEDCVNLTQLILPNNTIKDLTPIKSLAKLEGLDLAANEVEDISAVANFQHLVEIWLSNNPIKDYTPLADCPKLKRVYIAKGDQELLEKLPKILNHKVEVLFDTRLF